MKHIKRERSQLVIVSVYGVALALAFITAIFNVGLDLKQIGSDKFIGNLALNYFISIIMIMASMRDSEAKELLKAYYLDASAKLLATLSKIRNRSLEGILRLYAKHRYKLEWQEFIDSHLFKAGISKEIYNLTDQELKALRKKSKLHMWLMKTLHRLFKKVKVPNPGILSKDKYNLIMYLKRGKFNLKEVKAEDVLSEYDEKNSYRDMHSNRSRIIASSLGPKLVLVLFVSVILAAIDFGKGAKGIGQILTDLVVRLSGIGTSIFAGHFVGPELVGDKVRLKNSKDLFCCDFLSSFDSGAYRPTEEEMSKEVIANIKSIKEEPKTIERSEDNVVLEDLTPDEWKHLDKYREEKKKNPSP